MTSHRAVRVHKFGGPEVLQVDQVDKLTPQDGQLLIRVHAVGVNPFDAYVRNGAMGPRPFPFIPGGDCAGTVEEVGAGVTEFKVGDRVFTVMRTETGAYAEYTLATPDKVCKLSDKLSFAQGAAIGIPYFTAYKALHVKTHPQKGQTVLVHGASGAVGIAAVQDAKALGLRVFGTAGSQQGLDLVKKLGADLVFNHKEEGYLDKIKEATEGKGVDVILEMVASVNLQKDLQILNNRGAIVIIGSGGNVEINPGTCMMKESQIIGLALPNLAGDEWSSIKKGVESGQVTGWLQPVVAKEYKLEEAGKAQADVAGGGPTLGKVVLNTTRTN